MEPKNIIIIGSGLAGKTALLLSKLGENTELITVDEARKRGVDISAELEAKLNAVTEIPEITTFKYNARPQFLNHAVVTDTLHLLSNKFQTKQEKKNRQQAFTKIHNNKYRR